MKIFIYREFRRFFRRSGRLNNTFIQGVSAVRDEDVLLVLNLEQSNASFRFESRRRQLREGRGGGGGGSGAATSRRGPSVRGGGGGDGGHRSGVRGRLGLFPNVGEGVGVGSSWRASTSSPKKRMVRGALDQEREEERHCDGEEEEWAKTEGSRGIAAFASFLVVSETLTHLDLAHNAIGADLFYLLCEGLSRNVSLLYLDISSNRLNADAGAPLGQLLSSRCPPLQTCYCAANALGDHGAKDLAAQLCSNTLLCTLDLSCNALGDGGLESLALVLGELLSLTHLNLRCRV